MSNPVVKNYIDPMTGDLVIEGGLKVGGDAVVTGLLDASVLKAASTDLGGIKAANAGAGDTVECKINSSSKKLFVPTYPVVPKAANQAISVAEDAAALLVDFNALLLKLKTAGLMTAD